MSYTQSDSICSHSGMVTGCKQRWLRTTPAVDNSCSFPSCEQVPLCDSSIEPGTSALEEEAGEGALGQLHFGTALFSAISRKTDVALLQRAHNWTQVKVCSLLWVVLVRGHPHCCNVVQVIQISRTNHDIHVIHSQFKIRWTVMRTWTFCDHGIVEVYAICR